MNTLQEESIDALLSAGEEQELFVRIAKIGAEMGFEHCAYGVRMPVPISRPSVALYSNYPTEWQRRYQECSYIDVDPTVRHAMRSTLPVVWSDRLFEPARAMWEEARAHGLSVGWAQASRDASGGVGLLTLSRSAEPLNEAELSKHRAKMAWLTHYAHAAMAKLLAPKLSPETSVAVTAREKEVLRWTAEGKTAYEIAQILSISERTICFHINNIVFKLGASNKIHAAVKAATLGMLF
ncbi:autoinducer binding domain-containing protein [Duganella sp. CT11-25]|jgi:DNA-binding CsgD family transcriptional regulator|uniref:helix-turn-helix transcriptional regulator n=1 Tax=unclassified Duganella TaxID=2636909 RepID=UPI0039B0335A